MENLIQSLLQNLNVGDMFEGCLNYLASNNLTEEQYMQIIEICNDKLDDIQCDKYINTLKYNIDKFKSTLPEDDPLLDYINNITEIKAYVNDENEINDPKPSIEYVIETNYKNKNIVYFYEIVYDNVKGCNYSVKSISIKELNEIEMDEDSEDKENSSDGDDMEDVTINYDDENCVESLATTMNWNNTKAFKLLLNAMYQAFETDVPINW